MKCLGKVNVESYALLTFVKGGTYKDLPLRATVMSCRHAFRPLSLFTHIFLQIRYRRCSLQDKLLPVGYSDSVGMQRNLASPSLESKCMNHGTTIAGFRDQLIHILVSSPSPHIKLVNAANTTKLNSGQLRSLPIIVLLASAVVKPASQRTFSSHLIAFYWPLLTAKLEGQLSTSQYRISMITRYRGMLLLTQCSI